jgi:hypothetical protein
MRLRPVDSLRRRLVADINTRDGRLYHGILDGFGADFVRLCSVRSAAIEDLQPVMYTWRTFSAEDIKGAPRTRPQGAPSVRSAGCTIHYIPGSVEVDVPTVLRAAGTTPPTRLPECLAVAARLLHMRARPVRT